MSTGSVIALASSERKECKMPAYPTSSYTFVLPFEKKSEKRYITEIWRYADLCKLQTLYIETDDLSYNWRSLRFKVRISNDQVLVDNSLAVLNQIKPMRRVGVYKYAFDLPYIDAIDICALPYVNVYLELYSTDTEELILSNIIDVGVKCRYTHLTNNTKRYTCMTDELRLKHITYFTTLCEQFGTKETRDQNKYLIQYDEKKIYGNVNTNWLFGYATHGVFIESSVTGPIPFIRRIKKLHVKLNCHHYVGNVDNENWERISLQDELVKISDTMVYLPFDGNRDPFHSDVTEGFQFEHVDHVQVVLEEDGMPLLPTYGFYFVTRVGIDHKNCRNITTKVLKTEEEITDKNE